MVTTLSKHLKYIIAMSCILEHSDITIIMFGTMECTYTECVLWFLERSKFESATKK